VRAKAGEWSVVLTPTIPVPRRWFGDLKGKRVLGLASGGGQQIPIFSAAGALCTVMDYSDRQLESERMVARREGYEIEIVKADMTKVFPFADGSFDLIFHPVSNCYVKDVLHVWRECSRVLRQGGALLAGLDNGINFLFDEDETKIAHSLPFDPLSDPDLYRESIEGDWGIQFSHSIEEQIGGQLMAGFRLTDIFQDYNSAGILKDRGVPTFFATRAVKD
jgi:SAM-dependent methyltransferase